MLGRLTHPVVLQWGRGSVAAEMATYSGTPTITLRGFNGAAARWPRRSTPGGQSSSLTSCFNGAAARWPRRFDTIGELEAFLGAMLQWGRGSVAAEIHGLHRQLAPSTHASMGPRLGGRGDDRRLSPRPTRPASLQWGRGSVAAEMKPGRAKQKRKGSKLQWGRGSVAAEI